MQGLGFRKTGGSRKEGKEGRTGGRTAVKADGLESRKEERKQASNQGNQVDKLFPGPLVPAPCNPKRET